MDQRDLAHYSPMGLGKVGVYPQLDTIFAFDNKISGWVVVAGVKTRE